MDAAPARDNSLISNLHELREAITTDRAGRLIDVETIIAQVREQRDAELTVCDDAGLLMT